MKITEKFNQLNERDRIQGAYKALGAAKLSPGVVCLISFEEDDMVIVCKVDNRPRIVDAVAMTVQEANESVTVVSGIIRERRSKLN